MNEEELFKSRIKKENARILMELEGRRRTRGMDYYIPNKMQLEAHKSTASTVCLVCGNRTGKSTYGIMEICYHVTRRYPAWYPEKRKFKHPIKAMISAITYGVVSRVIEPKLRAFLPHDYYQFKRSPQGFLSKVLCKDGSTIDILTLEMNDLAYESADWDFVWEDEPQQQRKREAIMRGLVDRKGLEVITFTPIAEPWMKEEIIDKADGKNIAVFTSSIYDNQFDIQGNQILSKEGIDRFAASLSEDFKDARLHGAFFTLRGAVYKEFSDAHVRTFTYKEEGDQKAPVICVLDPHDRLPHHAIWAFIDKTDDIFVDTEMIIHCELPELAKRIKNHERKMGYNMRKRLIDPNFGRKPAAAGSKASVIDELRKHGAAFFEPDDDVSLGHMIVREYLHYDRSKPITAINKPKLFFSRMFAPVTTRSMRNLQYEEWQGKTRGEKDSKETEKQKDSHGADTVRYLCITRPKGKRLLEKMPENEEPYY